MFQYFWCGVVKPNHITPMPNWPAQLPAVWNREPTTTLLTQTYRQKQWTQCQTRPNFMVEKPLLPWAKPRLPPSKSSKSSNFEAQIASCIRDWIFTSGFTKSGFDRNSRLGQGIGSMLGPKVVWGSGNSRGKKYKQNVWSEISVLHII